MKYSALIALLSLTLVACSGSKSAQKVNEDIAEIELTETDELLDDSLLGDAGDDFMGTETMSDAAPVATSTDESSQDAPIVAETQDMNISVSETETVGTYTVGKNETLMLIAFKIYGDYDQWKQIANLNQEILKGTQIKEGMQLKYYTPAQEFTWNPEGLPYLIKTGDTLGRISDNVYQTPKKWKVLWDNNRPLIKDPNRIFAGFTIFYPELSRDVASEEL